MLLLQAPPNMKGEMERSKELAEKIKTDGCGFLHYLYIYSHFCLGLDCQISLMGQEWPILEEILLNSK